MVNDESLLREVDEGLAEDKLWRNIQKRGPLLLGLAAVIVVGVAARQGLSARTRHAAEEAARAYRGLPADASSLSSFLADAPKGYEALALYRRAGLRAAEGERAAAIEDYRAVYERGNSDRLSDLARIRAAHLAFVDGREAVMAHLDELETDETALGYFAREALALAALRAGDFQTAETMFRAAAAAPSAPAGVRSRAGEFAALSATGKGGVVLPWPSLDAAPAAPGAAIDAMFDNFRTEDGDLGALLRGDDEGAPADVVEEGLDAAGTDETSVESDPPVETLPPAEALDDAAAGGGPSPEDAVAAPVEGAAVTEEPAAGASTGGEAQQADEPIPNEDDPL